MTISEQPVVTVLGKVMGVFRRCASCEEWKPLEHYLRMKGSKGFVGSSVKTCAACRRQFGVTKADGGMTYN